VKRILFVGHDASLSGAPIVLLHLLRWLKTNRPDWHFDILLLSGGQLEPEYSQLGKVLLMPPGRPRYAFARLEHKLRRKLGIPKRVGGRDFPLGISDSPYDIVVGNTILTLPVLRYFRDAGITTVAWLHEMEQTILKYYTSREFRSLCNKLDHLILASKRAAAIVDGFSIRSPYSIVYDFSVQPIHGVDSVALLDIPDHAFVVLGCGTVEPRKGSHLFVELAEQLCQLHPDIYFVWVGEYPAKVDNYAARLRSIVSGNDRIIFTGRKRDLGTYFERADVFALTSLEDPFPLVCLEAAECAKPIICFADAGGMPEFVEDDCGFVVPLGDLSQFADRILRLRVDPTLKKKLGLSAAVKVRQRHNLNTSCSRIAELIEQALD
jgi:glycosyltransferase involved in cell wall biosynthesis